MKWVEPAGLVKFDFLGLKTLTVLDRAAKLCAGAASISIVDRLPLDDAPTYEMLARGETVGMFQVESQGMRRALLDMRPDRFEDIIALVALYRPGPMANIPTYCARKHRQEEPPTTSIPSLEPILRETFGVIVYQEQVMQVGADARRLFARRRRSSAARHGQEDPLGDGRAARRVSSPARSKRGIASGAGRRDLRIARQVRRLRLQQEPRGGLRAGRLPDRLHEGELSGRVPGRVDDAGHAATPTSCRIPHRGHRLGIKVEPPSVNRSAASSTCRRRYASTMRWPRSRASARRRWRSSSRCAATNPFPRSGDFASRVNPRAINKRVSGKPRRRGCVRRARTESRARLRVGAIASSATANRAHESAVVGQNELFGGVAARGAGLMLPALEAWLPAERLQREYDADWFLPVGASAR